MHADETKLSRLVESAPIGIVVTDDGGCIDLVNKEAERLFGYSSEELLGRSVEILLPESLRRNHVGQRANYLENPYFRPMGIGQDLLARAKDGREFLAEISLNSVNVGGRTLVMSFIVNVTSQRQVEDALRRSEELLKSTISSMDDLVIVLDRDGRFLRYELPKGQHRYFLGEEPQGKLYTEVLPGLAAKEVAAAIDGLKKGEGVQQFEFSVDINGRESWLDAKTSARVDKVGEFDGVTIVARDVTERRRVEMKLADYSAELETQNAELDAFAHTVAHDLKTPVALVVGFSELLQQSAEMDTNSEQFESLNQIVVMGHRLNSIINELLLLSTVRKTDVDMAPLDMKVIVEEAQAKVTHLAETHQAMLILPYSWPSALGYGPWIEEVWANFLSNAMKYGGRPPRIKLGATAQPDGMTRFWVKDSGDGIPSEDQERIFAPFTQLSQVRARGHGLGLSIVRRIVEKCNGKVGVESEAGKGATFWFTLPTAPE